LLYNCTANFILYYVHYLADYQLIMEQQEHPTLY